MHKRLRHIILRKLNRKFQTSELTHLKGGQLTHLRRILGNKLVTIINKQTQNLTDSGSMSEKLYIIDYNLTEGNLCATCKTKHTTFISLLKGYRKYCCVKCAVRNKEYQKKFKQTSIEKYGVENPSQCDQIKDKKKQTFLKHYKVDNIFKATEFKEQQIQNNLNKYGKKYYSQTEEFICKSKQTCLGKYGVGHQWQFKEVQEKVRQTNLKLYGVDNAMQSKEVQEKQTQTCFDKYGVENYAQTKEYKEKFKQTCLKNYGVEYPMQSKEVQEKSKQTCLLKYGVENYAQSDGFKQYMFENKDKFQKKIYETKKINGTFNISKPEEKRYSKLCTIHGDHNVTRQHKSKEYPFACDFYIKHLDLYIECHYYWTHGEEPFNENNLDHKNIISEWKAKNTPSYDGAIHNWTDLDPRKLQTVIDNKLNMTFEYNNKNYNYQKGMLQPTVQI